jgi:hypothetical protein
MPAIHLAPRSKMTFDDPPWFQRRCSCASATSAAASVRLLPYGPEENVDMVFPDEPLDRPSASAGTPLVILDDE